MLENPVRSREIGSGSLRAEATTASILPWNFQRSQRYQHRTQHPRSFEKNHRNHTETLLQKSPGSAHPARLWKWNPAIPQDLVQNRRA